MKKTILAATVAVMMLSPLSWAVDPDPSAMGLRLSHPTDNGGAAAAVTGEYSTYSNNSSNSDMMPLRGHVTTLPKGTMLMVKTDRPLNTFSSKIGDAVSGTVETDVYLDNQVVVPAGSVAEGEVTGVTPATHLGKSGELEIQFSTIKTPSGMVFPIRGHIVTADNTGILRGDSQQAQVLKTLGIAAGGAGAGTLMGTAAGGLIGSAGSGAVFGLAAGSLVGIGYAIVRQGKQVEIPGGARLSVVLDQSISPN